MNQPLAKPGIPPASLNRTVIAGAVGNVLEWYDFSLFGYFAPVIARQFLPAEDGLASLLETFGVFAVGFLMRPLGGLVFGTIGDRLGRKLALGKGQAVRELVGDIFPTAAALKSADDGWLHTVGAHLEKHRSEGSLILWRWSARNEVELRLGRDQA